MVCLEEFRDVLGENGGWDRLVPVRLADTDALAEPERAAAFPDLPPFDRFPEFKESYDLVVTLNPDLGSAVLCERIRAVRRLGRVKTYDGELRLLGPWAKYVFSMVNHRAGNLFNLVDMHMGMAGLAPSPQAPALAVGPHRADQAREALRSAGWRGGRPLVALQAGASDLHRAWEIEKFAALAERLLEDGAEMVLLGDPREAGRAEQLAGMVSRPVVNLAGKTGLALLPAVVKACDLLVSNDTGTIHVAAAVGTPALGLYFATAYYSETAPYGSGHAALQVEIPCAPCNASARCPAQKCRDHLGVPEVLETVRWILRPGSEPPPVHPTLRLYRSRFLANGTLLYEPARTDPPSASYLAGLLGRMVWEAALGIPRDPGLEAAWEGASRSPEWQSAKQAMAGTVEVLEESIRRGLGLAVRLRQALATGDRDRILPLHGQLAGVGEVLSGLGARSGILGDYIRFEMMDMDYAGYPELAVQLEEKYGSLADWIGRIKASLDFP